MHKSPSQAFDRGVTIAFIAAVIVIAIWTVANGVWWGSLFNGNQTWLIDLPSQPVWSPPDLPNYADFRRDFRDLPLDQPEQTTIGLELKWDFMLINFFLHLLGVTVVFAAITCLSPAGPHNVGIHLIRSLALSLSGAAAICFVVWLLVGGWGPPSPVFFGLVGLAIGISAGVVTWSRQVSTSQ